MDEFLAFGQDVAFVGIGIDELLLRQVLDNAALSDAELAAGPIVWAGFPDRFPDWSTATIVDLRDRYLLLARCGTLSAESEDLEHMSGDFESMRV